MANHNILSRQEIEQDEYREVERKFIYLSELQFESYRKASWPIEQYYVSMPSEPFSLRMRSSVKGDVAMYEATLKDRGIIGEHGLDRVEVTTPISSELYEYYKSEDTPMLRKLRAEPLPGIAVDFYEDGFIQVEAEDEKQWELFTKRHGGTFIDITGEPLSDNEYRAYKAHHKVGPVENGGNTEEKDMYELLWRTISKLNKNDTATVHIGGRSGSGKSTVVRELAARLEELGITTAVLSTDDYHRGSSWLTEHNGGQPWTKWDDVVVYDIAAMADDLHRLRNGDTIQRRGIDWMTVEPVYDTMIDPARVVVIEGIYAMAPEITKEDDVLYELKTPLATCVGRRLLRDLRERPQFADPAESLLYMLTDAEPAYRRQRQVI